MSKAEIAPLALAYKQAGVRQTCLLLSQIRLEEGQRADLSSYSTEELFEELARLKIEIDWIRDELRAEEMPGNERGYEWRQEFHNDRACARRMVAAIEIQLTRRERERVAQPVVVQQVIKPDHDEQNRLVQIAAAKMAKQIIERRDFLEGASERKKLRIAFAKDQDRQQAELFVAAAKKVLGLEGFKAIWAQAKEMFPDDPAWGPASDVVRFKAPADQQGKTKVTTTVATHMSNTFGTKQSPVKRMYVPGRGYVELTRRAAG